MMKFAWFMMISLASLLVAYGETRVHISGLSGRSEGQVLESMGGRLDHVRGSAATPASAEDAAFLLGQVMKKDGYDGAKVSWKIASPDEIRLIVDEGVRYSLGKVRVLGVSKSDQNDMARLFRKVAEKDRFLFGGAAPFRESDIDAGLIIVRRELNADGYWDAQVLVQERRVDDRTGVVDLTLDCSPGPRCLIGEPKVTSVDSRGVNLVSEVVRPYVGKTATTANLNAMRLAAEEIAVSRGYPNSTVKVGRSPVAGAFVPEFRVDLGKRLKLNRVSVTGLERTDSKRVLRRMEVARDSWYNEAAMNRAVRGLLATGAFSSARIETEEVGDKMVDATLHLTEAKAKEVGFAAGYGSYEGFIGRVSYSDRNLFGNVIGLNSGLEVSSRGLLGELRLTDPWFLGKDLPLSGRLYAFIYGHEGYDPREEGIEGKLIWKFGDHYAVDLSAAFAMVNLSEDGLPIEELGETVYLHQRVKLNQSLDYRDSIILPTKGWHLDCPVEIGSAIGDISTSYAKFGLSGGWYKRIHRFYDLGIGGSLGGIFPFGDSEDLPIDLRMFNGGSRSVRSFPNRELGPLVDGYPTGGEAGWNTNVELMRNIWGSLKGVAFVDAGGLARNREDWGAADVELATGLGFRLDLPIGPVRLEYGYNLTRDEGEPSGTLHFAIGFAY